MNTRRTEYAAVIFMKNFKIALLRSIYRNLNIVFNGRCQQEVKKVKYYYSTVYSNSAMLINFFISLILLLLLSIFQIEKPIYLNSINYCLRSEISYKFNLEFYRLQVK